MTVTETPQITTAQPNLSLISTQDEPNAEVQKYVEELVRLAHEIKERFQEGEPLQVLSSLAAIPTVHMSIAEGCKTTEEVTPLNEERIGLYL